MELHGNHTYSRKIKTDKKKNKEVIFCCLPIRTRKQRGSEKQARPQPKEIHVGSTPKIQVQQQHHHTYEYEYEYD